MLDTTILILTLIKLRKVKKRGDNLLTVITCKKQNQRADHMLPTYNATEYTLPIQNAGKGAKQGNIGQKTRPKTSPANSIIFNSMPVVNILFRSLFLLCFLGWFQSWLAALLSRYPTTVSSLTSLVIQDNTAFHLHSFKK